MGIKTLERKCETWTVVTVMNNIKRVDTRKGSVFLTKMTE